MNVVGFSFFVEKTLENNIFSETSIQIFRFFRFLKKNEKLRKNSLCGSWAGLGWAGRAGLGWAGLGWVWFGLVWFGRSGFGWVLFGSVLLRRVASRR